MTTIKFKTRFALIGIMACGLLSAACNSPTPTPGPTPPPTPTYSVGGTTLLERPNSYTWFYNTLALTLAANETTGRFLNFPSCVTPSVTNLPAGITVQLFTLPPFTITQLSHTGSTAGAYLDPMVPYTSGCMTGFNWADFSVAAGTAPGTYTFNINDLAVTITVNTFTMPDMPSMPMYIGYDPFSTLSAHNLDPDSTIDVQAPLAMNYINLLRAHRIEPFGQVPTYPPIVNNALDIDEFSEYGGSFRQTSVTGALGETCMQVHSSELQTQSYYQATEATLEANTFKGWNYVVDEPTPDDIATVAVQAQLSKQYAPSMETMITHVPVQQLIGLIDHFAVIFEQFKQPTFWSDYSQAPNYWVYGSCSSHGSCDNGVVGTNDASPDLSIDQLTIHSRMYPVVTAALGPQAGFYYAANTDYGAMDVWTDQYNWGSNGDGQLLYPAISGAAIPSAAVGASGSIAGSSAGTFSSNFGLASLRLKMLRQGMFDVEYLKTYGFSGIVTDQFHWDQNHADLDALRAKSVLPATSASGSSGG